MSEAVYQQLAGIPTLTSARIAHSDKVVDVVVGMSVKDLTKHKKRTLSCHLITTISNDKVEVILTTPPSETEGVLLDSVHPDTSLHVTFKKDTETKSVYAEIWRDFTLERVVDLATVHGDPMTDDMFGGYCWSPCKTRVTYIAEAAVTKEEKDKCKYEYRQDWGEKLLGKHPIVAVLDVQAGTVQVSPVEGYSPATPVLLKDGSVVCVGYLNTSHLHGLYACNNRPSRLIQVDEAGGVSMLTTKDSHVRSVHVSPDQTYLVYLSNGIGGAHDGSTRLVKMDLTTREESVLVEMVDSPKLGEFPGLFVDRIPRHCWYTHNTQVYVVLTTLWNHQRVIITVNQAGQVKRHCEPSTGSWSLLNVQGEWLLAVNSSPNTPNALYMGKMNPQGTIDWQLIHQTSPPLAVQWSVVHHPERHEHLESILLEPTAKQGDTLVGGDRPPLILFPHGGPHSAFDTSYMQLPAALALLGFAVALVNYSGSKGYGQAANNRLLGHVGDYEVQDTHHVALKLLETDKFDMNRTMITGGSHGGFTAAILIGQYPDFYKACVLRNPVMNIGTMAASTDIPDWCFAECDISYSFTQPTVITPSNYTKMYACSPMAVAHNVTTPTLLMLGVNDRRVPPTQGLEWFHYQRSRNLDVQCRMYPDNGHALDTLDAEHFGYTHLSTFLLDHTH